MRGTRVSTQMTATALVRFAAALLAATALLAVACADDEEQLPDETLPSETASRTAPTSDATPSPAATTPAATVTPAPVPSDWKTYTDAELGFSLKYPPDLTAKDLTTPGNTSGLSERVIDIRSETDTSRGVSISVSSVDADWAPKEWALEYTACLPETIEERVVKGSSAVFCTEDALGPHPSLVIKHFDKVYHIGWVLASNEFDGVLASLLLPQQQMP